MLSSYIWKQEKKVELGQRRAENKIKTQDILKEIEKAHLSYFSDLEESEKQFDKFLVNQGFNSEEKKVEQTKKKENNLGLKSILLVPDEQKTKESGQFLSQMDIRSSGLESLMTSSKKIKQKMTKIPQIKRACHQKDWNYSTKPSIKEYISNLNDFFPRDPYTLLPSNEDLIFINKELKGMSLAQVKEFMKKNLRNSKSSPAYLTSNQVSRPFYYKPKNIIDTQAKIRSENENFGIDRTGLLLGDDINSFGFRQVQNFVYNNIENFFLTNSENYQLNLTNNQHSKNKLIDDKLEIVEHTFSPELANFMMDKRSGKMSQKYEKVFIS